MADNPRAEVDFFANFRNLIRDAQRAGGRAGDQFGERFTRDAQGRLRDSRGRYVREGEAGGRAYGEGFNDGAEGEVDNGSGGGLKGKLGGVLGGLGAALAGASVAAGVAAGGAFVVGYQQAIEEEAQQGKFAAQLGLDPAESRRLGELSSRMYRDAWGESLAEVQDAMRGVLQGGILPEGAADADIERVTGKVLDLSAVFDQDLAGATEAVSQIVRNGLAPDADSALDILTRGFQNGADRGQDLLDTFTEYSPLFKDLGIDAASMTGILEQGLGAGARNSDLVADAFKELGIRAQDGSELSMQAFEDLGLSGEEMAAKIAAGGPEAAEAVDTILDRLRGMEDPVARNATAVALFGTQAEDLGESLFAIDPSEAAAGLGDITGATDDVRGHMATTQETIEGFKRKALGGLSDFVGGTVIPKLTQLSDWFQSDALPAIKGGLESLTGGFQGNGDGSFLATVGEQAANVVRIVREEVLPWLRDTLWPWLRDTLIPGWLQFAGVMVQVWTRVWQGIQTAWGFIQPILADVWGWVIEVAMPAWANFATVMQDVWNRIWLAIQAAWAFIQPILQNVWTWVQTYLIPVFQTYLGVVQTVWTGIWTAIQAAWAIVSPIFFSVVGYIEGALSTAFNVFRTTAETVFGAVHGAVSWAWGIVEPIFNDIVDFIDSTLVPVWDRISSAVGAAFDRVPGIIKGALRIAGNVVSGFLGGAAGIADAIGLDDLAGSLREAAGKADAWGEGPTGSTPTGRPMGGAYAAGGFVSGGIPGKDSVRAWLMPGEYVLTTDMVRQAGLGNLEAWRNAKGFADGGPVGWVRDAMGKGAQKMRDIAAGGLSRIPFPIPQGEGLKGLPFGIAHKIRDAVIEFVKGKADELDAGGLLAGMGATSGGPAGNWGKGMAAAAGWIRQAMAITGVPDAWFPRLMARVNQESGGNPRAINLWDSNARKGVPSKGLLQTIDPTFNAYKLPGMNDIWNPVHNAVAAIRYMIARYGSVFNLPSGGYAEGGLVTVHGSSFDSGGVLAPGYNLVKNMTGKDEPLVPAGRGQLFGDVYLQERTHVDVLMQQAAMLSAGGQL